MILETNVKNLKVGMELWGSRFCLTKDKKIKYDMKPVFGKLFETEHGEEQYIKDFPNYFVPYNKKTKELDWDKKVFTFEQVKFATTYEDSIKNYNSDIEKEQESLKQIIMQIEQNKILSN